MKQLVLIFICLLGVSSYAQQSPNGIGPKKSDSYVIKAHGPKNPKINKKYPEIQIGDSTKNKFDPSIVLTGWDNEVRFKMNLDIFPGKMNRFVEQRNGADFIRMVGNGWEYEAGMNDNGNFEWSLILDKEPPTNMFTITYESEGLEFWYQDTADFEPEDDVYMADSVIYSYVVMHESKKDIRITLDKQGDTVIIDDYDWGKVFHIYRPKAWDSSGDTVWAWISIDQIEQTLTLGADWAWLKSATYPVTIDPFFGFDNEPAGSYTTGNIDGSQDRGYTASTGDTYTDIEVFASVFGGTETVKMAVYTIPSAGDMNNGTLLGSVQTATVSNLTPNQWHSGGTFSVAMLDGVEYGVAVGESSGTVRIGVTGCSSCDSRDSDNTMDATHTEDSNQNFDISVRATYTVGGAAADNSYVRRIKEGEGK